RAIPTPPSPGPELPVMAFTLEEAAEILHCGRTTIYTLVKDGKIRTVPVGRKRLVSTKELERFLNENAV
ncbi:MAG: helix-turn-helix domain-containing protein, partial [Geothrix sp.]|nr:helix-turn-helix domain-containing protein [Geothrix sp.]